MSGILNRLKGSISYGADVIEKINRGPKVQVFGAAPSLSVMRKMNEKKTIFYGATFWYYFRVYYPVVFPILFFIFMISSLAGWNEVQGHLVLGSVLSLISSLSVILSYIMIMPWRKHPSILVLYRAVTSMGFSINIILNAINKDTVHCRNFAVVTQVFLLSGECWLTTIAWDLVKSLTNPFTSYKGNVRTYTALVWTFTAFISFVFFFNTSCQGRFDEGICWVNITSTRSPCLWGYFLFWIVIMYVYQMWASAFAYIRLRKGLPDTFAVRKQCALDTYKVLSMYAAYLSLMMFFFTIISSQSTKKQHDQSLSNFSLFLLFVIANRGSVDGAVWFLLHDFHRDPPRGSTHTTDAEEAVAAAINKDDTDDIEKRIQGPVYVHSGDGDAGQNDSATGIAGVPSSAVRSRSHSMVSRLRSSSGAEDVVSEIKKDFKNITKTFTKLADMAITEFDEADLSPQVNMALRQQIVRYVTLGVKQAILREQLTMPPRSAYQQIMDKFTDNKDPALVDDLEVLSFQLDSEYPFKAFAPTLFKQLRSNEGIDDEKFLNILSSPANERLSEGASGAFMFFCGGGEFIVKTIRGREARVLHQSLPEYSTYLQENKNSLLCRFLGSYSLQMFEQTFYFVVMLNCFDPKADIQERFDIKGSWVGRSADAVKATKRVVCRHCNSYFVPMAKEQCTVIVGRHEANVVLKDNDLRTKISLHTQDANRVVEILKKDSDLLGKLGVMDYSLLLGVKKWKFPVNVTNEELNFKTPTAESNPNKLGISTFKAVSVTGPAVYYLGIVDFLQDWSTKKRIERGFKMYFARKDPDGLSVMHPKYYKQRFQTKMDQIFDLEGGGGGSGSTVGGSAGGFDAANANNAKIALRAPREVSGDSSGKIITTHKPFVTDVLNPLHQRPASVPDDDDINVEVVDL